ncbi:MAG: NAD(P)H-hydrate epimerase, partial [Bacteroidota bacterium]
MPFPTLNVDIPYITTEQMVEVDHLMIKQYRIELIQMMENAGRCLALVAKERFLENNLVGKQVIVLAGTGGNGGGAM